MSTFLGWPADRHLFFQLCVSILVAIVNGSIFCFAMFVPALGRAPFNFSTTETNVISTVGVITSYFSLPTGQLYDRTSPRVTLALGTGINVTGWLLMFGVFSGYLSQNLASVATCYAITQFAATFFETGSVIPNLDAFALHEGRVVMIQKTFMGLGTSVVAAMFNAFFMKLEIRWFFLFLCFFSLTAGSLGAMVIKRPQLDGAVVCRGLNVHPEHANLYDRPFYYAIGVLFANLAFLFAIDIAGAMHPVTDTARLAFGFVAVVLSFAFFPAMALLPARRVAHSEVVECSAASAAETPAGAGVDEEGVAAVAAEAPVRNIHGLAKNVQRLELWLMWYVSFATWGAMTLINSNTEQIYKATTGPRHIVESENTVFVSLFGIGSALGRIVVGFAKDPMKRRFGWEVWWFFPIAPVLMVITLPLFLAMGGAALRVPFFFVGFATGVAWGATVLIIKRVFTEAGRHYSFLYTAGMLTPLFFNLWLFSSTYEERSRDQGQRSLADCDGVGCIGVPIGVCIAMNLVAIGAAVYFVFRMNGGSIFVDPPELQQAGDLAESLNADADNAHVDAVAKPERAADACD